MYPGTRQVKRVRWHPHLSGSLMTSFDRYDIARLAHQKFEEVMRRDTHQLKVCLQPGDLYIWNNFTILHGRERVLKVPRTGVGVRGWTDGSRTGCRGQVPRVDGLATEECH